ncbi:hypothetical protein F5148DRAFT_159694 [Russula earlei]|uniref:Uncharacterized protein n=1 Tax=Russula earlei TaxID=71964 RepID=A0ACC0U6F6_9AGAM|nr:hypothetical protein F5148DRAFT_159694 [Russula earlei]
MFFLFACMWFSAPSRSPHAPPSRPVPFSSSPPPPPPPPPPAGRSVGPVSLARRAMLDFQRRAAIGELLCHAAAECDVLGKFALEGVAGEGGWWRRRRRRRTNCLSSSLGGWETGVLPSVCVWVHVRPSAAGGRACRMIAWPRDELMNGLDRIGSDRSDGVLGSLAPAPLPLSIFYYPTSC